MYKPINPLLEKTNYIETSEPVSKNVQYSSILSLLFSLILAIFYLTTASLFQIIITENIVSFIVALSSTILTVLFFIILSFISKKNKVLMVFYVILEGISLGSIPHYFLNLNTYSTIMIGNVLLSISSAILVSLFITSLINFIARDKIKNFIIVLFISLGLSLLISLGLNFYLNYVLNGFEIIPSLLSSVLIVLIAVFMSHVYYEVIRENIKYDDLKYDLFLLSILNISLIKMSIFEIFSYFIHTLKKRK